MLKGNKGKTVAAISSPPGRGAIAVIRLTGDESLEIALEYFQPAGYAGKSEDYFRREIKKRRVYFGKWFDTSGRLIDEIQMIFYKAPNSYTGEDLVEFFCHGGRVVTEMIYKNLLEKADPAQPGEFTYRAFLNNKLDLIKARAINDLINAKTEKAAAYIAGELDGKLSNFIHGLEKGLLKSASMIEVQIDYPDELYEASETEKILSQLKSLQQELGEVLETANNAIRLKEGIDTAILGSPNVGKSTLLNRLIRQDRAIVTDIPGTTRDYIKAELNINGILINLIDTAGLRETQEEIEKIGVKRTLELVKNVPFVLFLFDISRNIEESNIELIKDFIQQGKKVLVLLNKSDTLTQERDAEKDVEESISQFKKRLNEITDVHVISALRGEGVEELEELIHNTVKKLIEVNAESMIFSRVQQRVLNRANRLLKETLGDIKNGVTMDIIAQEIREIILLLNGLTGRDYNEDIVETLFSDFCVGK